MAAMVMASWNGGDLKDLSLIGSWIGDLKDRISGFGRRRVESVKGSRRVEARGRQRVRVGRRRVGVGRQRIRARKVNE